MNIDEKSVSGEDEGTRCAKRPTAHLAEDVSVGNQQGLVSRSDDAQESRGRPDTHNGNPKNLNRLGRSLVLSELGASTDAPRASNDGDPQSFSAINRPGIKET